MSMSLRHLLLAAPFAFAGLLPLPAKAQGYPIDCAILLCLAGGWPASVPCAAARAEFIRRITPWPIEPPLQIWRCPMGAAAEDAVPLAPLTHLVEASLRARGDSAALTETPALPLLPVQSAGASETDSPNEVFDLIRSIHVWHIVYRQRRDRNDDCERSDATRLGTYGPQGQFGWSRVSADEAPPASGLTVPGNCRDYSFRAVFVDWRDHAGTYGFEEVRY